MKKNILLLGHRGYRAKYPENTLLSFKKAFESGADGIECDIQKTKDGVFVIIHDETIDRTASNGKKGSVALMKYSDLKKITFGSRQHIPELTEFLESLPKDVVVNLELKEETLTVDDLPGLSAVIIKFSGNQRLLVSSFEHSLLPYFKSQGIAIGMLVGSAHRPLGGLGLLWRIIRIKPDYMNLSIKMFDSLGDRKSRIVLWLLKRLGCRIVFWTVNTESEFEKAYRHGDIIITDNVEDIRGKMKNK